MKVAYTFFSLEGALPRQQLAAACCCAVDGFRMVLELSPFSVSFSLHFVTVIFVATVILLFPHNEAAPRQICEIMDSCSDRGGGGVGENKKVGNYGKDDGLYLASGVFLTLFASIFGYLGLLILASKKRERRKKHSHS